MDIKSILNLWGGYVRYVDCKGYPTMQAFMREAPQTGNKSYLGLNDRELERVDLLIRQLAKEHELQFNILFLRYVAGFTVDNCCLKLMISRKYYYDQAALAEKFVAGALCGAGISFSCLV